ncbi:MAG: right-handed parallel beta-helix repeat-containing protein [Magnetococcales bacterium]|nr:right-handed parallel beta-helix repeat-containing protein [Magnetococcales bacterium]
MRPFSLATVLGLGSQGVLVLLLFLSASVIHTPQIEAAGHGIVHVDSRVVRSGDGRTWATAYKQLDEALSKTYTGQIRVAAGIYTPTRTRHRSASFTLKPGVALYGGFRGGENRLEQRRIQENPTVLSGDIGRLGEVQDNVYHVVTGAHNARLDGFIITGGNANGPSRHGKGGGFINDGVNSVIVNCILRDNRAMEGGGAYYFNESQPWIVNTVFENNRANKGGGVVLRGLANAIIEKSAFRSNIAAWRGGGLFIDYGASPVIRHATIAGNRTSGHGGGLYMDDTNSRIHHTAPTLYDVLFEENRAGFKGGAAMLFNRVRPHFSYITFKNNRAASGGGAVTAEHQVRARLDHVTFSGNRSTRGEAILDFDATSSRFEK